MESIDGGVTVLTYLCHVLSLFVTPQRNQIIIPFAFEIIGHKLSLFVILLPESSVFEFYNRVSNKLQLQLCPAKVTNLYSAQPTAGRIFVSYLFISQFVSSPLYPLHIITASLFSPTEKVVNSTTVRNIFR